MFYYKCNKFDIFFCVFILLSSFTTLISGCATYRPPATEFPWLSSSSNNSSQTFVATMDHEALWDAVADAVGQTFTIASEEPVRYYDNIMTEGRLETEPKIGASVFEPWHDDSVSLNDRVEATYQTIRRKAVVRIIPENNGFLVRVNVYCETEDMLKPMESNVSGTFIRNVNSNNRIVADKNNNSDTSEWFYTGQDVGLEQRLIDQILYRFNNPPNVIKPAEPVIL